MLKFATAALLLTTLLVACTSHDDSTPPMEPSDRALSQYNFGQKVLPMPSDAQLDVVKDLVNEASISIDAVSRAKAREKLTPKDFEDSVTKDVDLRKLHVAQLMHDRNCTVSKKSDDEKTAEFSDSGGNCPITTHIKFSQDSSDPENEAINIAITFRVTDVALNPDLDVVEFILMGGAQDKFTNTAAPSSASSAVERHKESSDETKTMDIRGYIRSQLYGKINVGFVGNSQTHHQKANETGKEESGWYIIFPDFILEVRREFALPYDSSKDSYFINGNPVSRGKYIEVNAYADKIMGSYDRL